MGDKLVKIQKYFEILRDVGVILDERYEECDRGGYVLSNEESGYCESCYRRLEYVAHDEEGRLRRRRDLPFESQPLDASILVEKRRREIASQRTEDRATGLAKLAREMGKLNDS